MHIHSHISQRKLWSKNLYFNKSLDIQNTNSDLEAGEQGTALCWSRTKCQDASTSRPGPSLPLGSPALGEEAACDRSNSSRAYSTLPNIKFRKKPWSYPKWPIMSCLDTSLPLSELSSNPLLFCFWYLQTAEMEQKDMSFPVSGPSLPVGCLSEPAAGEEYTHGQN